MTSIGPRQIPVAAVQFNARDDKPANIECALSLDR